MLKDFPFTQMRNKAEVEKTIVFIDAYTNANEAPIQSFTTEDDDAYFNGIVELGEKHAISGDFLAVDLSEMAEVQTRALKVIKDEYPELTYLLHGDLQSEGDDNMNEVNEIERRFSVLPADPAPRGSRIPPRSEYLARLCRKLITDIAETDHADPDRNLALFDELHEHGRETDAKIHRYFEIQTFAPNGGVPVLKRLIEITREAN